MHSGFVAAISVLAAVFFGSLLTLIVVIRRRFCRANEVFLNYARSCNIADQNLIENVEVPQENTSDVELGEVAAQIEEPAGSSCQTRDVNLLPHCLGILKAVHLLTDYVVKQALVEARKVHLPETLPDLVPLANKIGVGVDEVVRSMYPPFDPRLLEARCSALVLSAKNLLLLVGSTLLAAHPTDWVALVMSDVEEHLKVLREASASFEKQFSSVTLTELKIDDEEEEEKLIDVESEPSKESSSSV